ncbi:MAG TPA: tetratricopeptide repeat protein [Chloroflexi bacterium]|nr:tetratricopeptide repeat protein [Chloroflexota bacterium]
MFSWFSEVFDVTLLATIGLVFFATLLGAYIRARRRDPCLKSFVDYVVTVECTDDKIIWGRLELASTGLELRYTDSVADDNHVESSYVLYTQEFGKIHAIYRYIDELDAKTRARRRKDLDRSLHPRFLRRVARHIRNFISLASESLSEVLGLIIGGLRKPAGRYITEQSEVRLRELGTTFIGSVGSGYDPLLERFIGQKMVFEIMEDEDEVHEHVGIFKQYSPDFFEILDVQMPQKQQLSVEREQAVVAEQIKVAYSGGRLMVDNRSVQMVLLKSIAYGDHEEPVNAMIDSGEHIYLDVDAEADNAVLTFRILREVDMIVPRTRCVVRHRADYYRPEVMPSIIFDLGVKLRGAAKVDSQERRLRKQLEENPLAVMAMANLGALLAQKQQFDEAEALLHKAWELRNSLPDNGRRTRQLLQEIQRKRAATPQSRDALRALQATQGFAASETVTLH